MDDAPEGTQIELEHAIGYSCLPGSLHYHPTTSEFVYASGGTIGKQRGSAQHILSGLRLTPHLLPPLRSVVCDSKDPHNQVFLRGHDSNVSCLAMSKTVSVLRFVAEAFLVTDGVCPTRDANTGPIPGIGTVRGERRCAGVGL